MDAQITPQELNTAIAQAPPPKKKSPGLDGIIAEFYTWGEEIIQDDLLYMYNEFLSAGCLAHAHTGTYSLFTKKV
jgi:hypothetical protein